MNLATVMALKNAIQDREPDRPHALLDASVLEDLLSDLVDFHTSGLARHKKGKK